jgi:hypothetical protein
LCGSVQRSSGIRKIIGTSKIPGKPANRLGPLQAIPACRAEAGNVTSQGKIKMLETVVVVLLVLWVLGLVTSNTMGGLIHILLVIAIVVILFRVIQGRRI